MDYLIEFKISYFIPNDNDDNNNNNNIVRLILRIPKRTLNCTHFEAMKI